MILVGDDPASQVYTRTKHRLAQKLGIASTRYHFPADVDQATVLQQVRKLNWDDSVDVILVQAPLPAQLNGEKIVNAIDLTKDADGLHPLNQGGHYPVACTPRGIMALLKQYQGPTWSLLCGASWLANRSWRC